MTCALCPLQNCRKVPPEGNRDAKIALVGMGPGDQEEQYGRPFIGRSGQLLNRILKEIGIARKDLWVTNAALCRPRPVETRNGWIPQKKVETISALQFCNDRLLQELRQIQPKVIIAVGALSMEALTGIAAVTKIQGSLNRLKDSAGFDSTVIPLFHPAHLLRGEQRFYPTVVAGFRKALRLSETAAAPPGELRVLDPASPTVEDDIADLERLVNELLETGEDIAIDVETTEAEPIDAILTVVGFASLRKRLGVAVTVRTWNPATGTFDFTWNHSQWSRIDLCLRRLLAAANTKWYWNYGFDVTVLERFYKLGGAVRDGMVLHHLAYPDLLHGLDFAAHTHLDIPPWKYIFRQLEKSKTGTHRDLLIYNAQDALYTALLVPYLLEAVAASGNAHLEEHQLYMADMARRAHIRGIPVSLPAWQKVYDEHKTKRDDAEAVMHRTIALYDDAKESLNTYVTARRAARRRTGGAGAPPVITTDDLAPLATPTAKPKKSRAPQALLTLAEWNPDSADHACWYLYELLRLQPTRFTKGGPEKDPAKQVPSSSYKGVLVYMTDPRVKAFVDRAEEEAILRTLDGIRNDINPKTSRLHPSWNSAGTKGTRWTSRRNVQNWDSTIKLITEQPPDRCWIGADAAQIEYRVAAVLAAIPELLALFNAPAFDEEKEGWKKYDPAYDAHALVAVEVFGKFYTDGDLKRKKALRTMVKRVVYALFYGAYPEKIFGTILEDRRVPSDFRAVLTQNRIERIWAGFSARFPQWDIWADREVMKVKFTGRQDWPPFNRQHTWALSEMIEETKIRNTPIQRSAGDVVNKLFRAMDEEVRARGLDAYFVVHAHDACEWDVAKKDEAAVLELVNRHFDMQLESGGNAVHIYGQAKSGRTLAEV